MHRLSFALSRALAEGRLAAEQPALTDYSALAASDLDGGFEVLVEGGDRSLERAYTQRTCR